MKSSEEVNQNSFKIGLALDKLFDINLLPKCSCCDRLKDFLISLIVGQLNNSTLASLPVSTDIFLLISSL